MTENLRPLSPRGLAMLRAVARDVVLVDARTLIAPRPISSPLHWSHETPHVGAGANHLAPAVADTT